ncbi:sterol desaturase family protein [Dongia rigui]|uniref:Sterol desaturase family protein n=1 Tax=Dongia rigui TaxID=940149 RepID=A0ABU5DZ59_9PROT|nr:sterol desaturase family protein [Dongia rigui]MDY0872224.1 sterol desaturase family protein [Dongia rigui]
MNEAFFRLGIFLILFALLGLAETFYPRRPLRVGKSQRWGSNLGLLVIDVLAQRLTLGAIVFAAALLAEKEGWGLFHLLDWPFAIEALITLLVLDAAIYLQHVATHKVPLLWRLHRVHHTDLDVDLSTGFRFHPVEILLSALYKAGIVLALGADPMIVLIYEAALSAFSLFTHANLAIPPRWDRHLRYLICTPDMHRRHHSIDQPETDSNYGNILSLWDRLGRSYFEAPRLGQDGVVLGLAEEQDAARLALGQLLLLPFTAGRQPR